MAKPRITLAEALSVSAEARAVLGASTNTAAQEKAKLLLDLALDAALEAVSPAKGGKE